MAEVKIELAKTLLTFPHGVHAFIYVLSSTERFTDEDQNTLKEIKDLFGTSVLEHTIVVFTRADSKFNIQKYISTLRLAPPLPSDELMPALQSHPPRRAQQYVVQNPRSAINPIAAVTPRSTAYQFLNNDIRARYIGVDNQCKSEYQKKKTRDALLELIDVVQTSNKGRPFSDKYFDKAQQKLVQRGKEEKQAREKFLAMEHDQWSKALKAAEEMSNRLSDHYWKGVQQARLIDEQTYKDLIADTASSIDHLQKGFSALKGMLHGTSCISLYSLTDCAIERLNEFGDGSPNEIKERIGLLKKELQNIRGFIGIEIEQEKAELKNKILENESKEECKLALVYAKIVAHSAAQSQFQKMSISFYEEESKIGFTNTRKKIAKKLVDHVILMVAALNEHQAELEQVLKQRAAALTAETIAQLKKKHGRETSRLMPTSNLRCATISPILSGKYFQKHYLEVEKTCRTQAVDFLIGRNLHVIRQEAVEAEYQKDRDCYQTIAKSTDRDTRRIYEKCFNDIPEIPIVEGTPELTERFKFQFADVYVTKLLLDLEEDPDKRAKRQEELDRFLAKVKKERESCLTKLTEMTDVLTNVVCRLAPEYAKSLNKEHLQEIKHKNYSKAAKDLTPKVLAELSKGEENKQLQDETKTYFKSGDKISEAISIYARLNHDILMDLAKEGKDICFPAETTVVEERKGQMNICDVKVGDRLLAVTTDGILMCEDVFMLGHADSSADAIYVELQTEEGASILLSRGHLIHVGCHGNLKAARDVAIGDTVFAMVDFSLRPTKVTRVTETIKRGAYCPHTTGGSIVVNNVLASCYTEVINHQVAHAMLLPARMLYHLLPSGIFNWMFPYDETEGMPKLLLKMKNLYQLMW